MATESVANLIAKPSGYANAGSHYPDVHTGACSRGNEAGCENERVSGDKRNERTDEQAGSRKNETPNHQIEKPWPELRRPRLYLVADCGVEMH